MDKNRMYNDKKSAAREVHRLSGAMREVHRACGLWIIGGTKGSVSPKGGFSGCRERYFEFYSLSHMYDGGGRLWLPGCGELDIVPGDCLLIAPRVVHRYGACDDRPYVEDAIKFAGPVADMLYRSKVMSDGVCRLGPARRLLPVIELAQDPSPHSQIKANIELQKILFDIYNMRHREQAPDAIGRVMQMLREDDSRWFQVSELAEACGMSDDRFRRLFFRHTRMLPKEYIERSKLGRAAERLLAGNETVGVIASNFGYMDQFHFSRRFKLFTGFSPAAYRKAFGARRTQSGLNLTDKSEKS